MPAIAQGLKGKGPWGDSSCRGIQALLGQRGSWGPARPPGLCSTLPPCSLTLPASPCPPVPTGLRLEPAAQSGTAENQCQCREAASWNVSLWMSWALSPPLQARQTPAHWAGPPPERVCAGLGADLQGLGCALSQGPSCWQTRSRKAGEDGPPFTTTPGLHSRSAGSPALPFGLCLVRGLHLQVGCFHLGQDAETPLSQLGVLKAQIRVALLGD